MFNSIPKESRVRLATSKEGHSNAAYTADDARVLMPRSIICKVTIALLAGRTPKSFMILCSPLGKCFWYSKRKAAGCALNYPEFDVCLESCHGLRPEPPHALGFKRPAPRRPIEQIPTGVLCRTLVRCRHQ